MPMSVARVTRVAGRDVAVTSAPPAGSRRDGERQSDGLGRRHRRRVAPSRGSRPPRSRPRPLRSPGRDTTSSHAGAARQMGAANPTASMRPWYWRSVRHSCLGWRRGRIDGGPATSPAPSVGDGIGEGRPGRDPPAAPRPEGRGGRRTLAAQGRQCRTDVDLERDQRARHESLVDGDGGPRPRGPSRPRRRRIARSTSIVWRRGRTPGTEEMQ